MKPTDSKGKGILHALLVHSGNVHLPRLLQTHQRVTDGCQLSNSEINFMKDVCKVTGSMQILMNEYPDYHDFVARYISLIREITGMALANEMHMMSNSHGTFGQS